MMSGITVITYFCVLLSVFAKFESQGVYIDHGIPYKKGQLHVGELPISKTKDKSPLHAKAYFPLEVGEYPVIYFIGGLGGLVMVEYYEDVLYNVASHGFVVLGVDPYFPIYDAKETVKPPTKVGENIDKYFEEYFWLQKFMVNKITSTILWNKTGLMCHSSSCDDTLLILKANSSVFQSTIFLEPVSAHINSGKVNVPIPALMYGTELSEQGAVKCVIPGEDYNKFYDVWPTCPRIAMEVAQFGHCDILDSVPWKACYETKFCKTENMTRIPEYHMFVQGVISAFFVTTLQGGNDMDYLTNKTNIPLPLLELKYDMKCTSVRK